MNWKTLLFSFLLAAPALADDFKSANARYDAGKFAEAAAAYEKIEPKTANVYFNLGNALFRQERFGLAVLNYERARRLAPRDPDILANLQFAHQRLSVEDQPRLLRRIVESRTANEWSRYELASLWLTVLAIAGGIWLPRVRAGMILIAAIAGVATVATASALFIATRAAPTAIVVAGHAEARFAPSADATIHFQLSEGSKVAIREDRGAWIEVARADDQQGWVKSESLERVIPR